MRISDWSSDVCSSDLLDPLWPDYDFIIIDCPPALSLLTLNALTAADSVLVPMQCEYYALEGLTALLQTIDALKARLNPGLEIEGVLRKIGRASGREKGCPYG